MGLHPGLALFAAASLSAAPAPPPPRTGLAPIDPALAVSTHGPFEMGDCKACHTSPGPKPGKLRKPVSALCFDCHDEYRGEVPNHPRSGDVCTGCHTPHNSAKRKLLR